jgi:hypothetical protein
VVPRILKTDQKKFQNTTCSGMTRVSLGLYSGYTPHEAVITRLLGEAIMDYENSDSVGGYSVPVDPMDLLQCDSCQ